MKETTDDVVSVLVNKQNPVILAAFKKVIKPLCQFNKFHIKDDGDFWKVMSE